MIAWKTIYQHIGKRYRVSASYVEKIHRGDRNTNTSKSRTVANALVRAQKKVEKTEAEVLA